MPASAPTILDQLKALSHDIRFEIVRHLSQSEHCVCELEGLLTLPQPTVSYHLGILRDAGLIRAEQRGKNVFHILQRPQLYALGGTLLNELLVNEPAAAAV